ncbi:Uncharacterised protein [Mycobacterium tuberculosis]|nr:Uncharacterised protein [Mycobacterium tuberculosis]
MTGEAPGLGPPAFTPMPRMPAAPLPPAKPPNGVGKLSMTTSTGIDETRPFPKSTVVLNVT